MADRLDSHLLDAEAASSISHSLSSLDQYNYDSVLIGASLNGKISTVRRFFCLFVLFDLLLCALMWLILVMLSADNDIIISLRNQIIYYSIQNSLFDIVMAGMCRFTILLLFYALLCFNTSFFVAVTTLGTCIFIIIKVLYFNWHDSNETAIQGFFLLVSFILSWVEVWFIDFRVVPQEELAKSYFSTPRDRYPPGFEALFRQNVSDRRRELAQRSEGASNFYSLTESPNESDDEGHAPKVVELCKCGAQAVNDVHKILTNQSWQMEKATETATVHSRKCPGSGKVYKMTTTLECAVYVLQRELYDSISKMPEWNPTVQQCERIQTLNLSSDVVYQVSAGNSIVSPRDLVMVRQCAVKESFTIIAAVSVIHPKRPEISGLVRAQSGPCCWALRQSPGNPKLCEVISLVNIDLKIRGPEFLVSGAIVNSLLKVADGLQTLAGSLSKDSAYLGLS